MKVSQWAEICRLAEVEQLRPAADRRAATLLRENRPKSHDHVATAG